MNRVDSCWIFCNERQPFASSRHPAIMTFSVGEIACRIYLSTKVNSTRNSRTQLQISATVRIEIWRASAKVGCLLVSYFVFAMRLPGKRNPTVNAEIIWMIHRNNGANDRLKTVPNNPNMNDGPALLQNANSLCAVCLSMVPSFQVRCTVCAPIGYPPKNAIIKICSAPSGMPHILASGRSGRIFMRERLDVVRMDRKMNGR